MILPRDLTEEEKNWFQTQKKFTPKSVAFALDGIVLLVHRDNPDTNITLAQLRNLLLGTSANWKQVSGAKNAPEKPVEVVFDQTGSSLVHFITDSIIPGQKLGPNIYAAGS